MPSSLVPEKPFLIYPSLAKSLGLEEALMLSALADRIQHMPSQQNRGFRWFELTIEELELLFPFWSKRDMQRTSARLREQGMIISSSASIESAISFRFAFNEKVQKQVHERHTQASPLGHIPPLHSTKDTSPKAVRHGTRDYKSSVSPAPNGTPSNNAGDSRLQPQFLSKNYIAPNWQPDEMTLAQLAQHNITRQFAAAVVPEFVTYWHERGEQNHSWGSKFIKYCLRKWRDFEEERYRKEQEAPMHGQWTPSTDAMDILVRQAAIRREFVEDAIPEFILYWRERGDSHRTWNTKFVQHVRIQWAKYNAVLEHNANPCVISPTWQPSQDVYDVLRLANIDRQFARELIPEFVLYWRDRGILSASWNTKYLQHVKRMWARKHSDEGYADGHSGSSNNRDRSTRELTLQEELTDRSWADGL